MLEVSPSVENALAQDLIQYAWLIDLTVDVPGSSGFIRITDYGVDLAYGGKTFTSAGDILTLPSITREKEIKLQSYDFTISGADQFQAALLAAQNMTGQSCEVLLALLNSDDTIIGTPISMYKGSFHGWKERDSGNSSQITISITSPWSQPEQTAGRITSDHSQKERYPGDNFFIHAHRERKNVGWGEED